MSIIMKNIYMYLSISLFMLGMGTHQAFAEGGTEGKDSNIEDLTAPQEKLYMGIIPGKRDALPHINDKAKKYNVVTWIGFVPEKTRTRVFLQGTEGMDYTMDRSDDGSKITLTFNNTRVENYNLMRFIDASHFGREVKRIDASRKSKTLTVTLTVVPGAQPNVSRTNGYIYLDFAHES